MIGMGRILKRIMKRKSYKSGKCRQFAQDGSREFITLIACISITRGYIPPALLYKGKGDLQDSWVEDVEDDDKGYFRSIVNRWLNNTIGLKWLQKVFEPKTRPKSPRI
jgi:hypothetical protein